MKVFITCIVIFVIVLMGIYLYKKFLKAPDDVKIDTKQKEQKLEISRERANVNTQTMQNLGNTVNSGLYSGIHTANEFIKDNGTYILHQAMGSQQGQAQTYQGYQTYPGYPQQRYPTYQQGYPQQNRVQSIPQVYPAQPPTMPQQQTVQSTIPAQPQQMPQPTIPAQQIPQPTVQPTIPAQPQPIVQPTIPAQPQPQQQK